MQNTLSRISRFFLENTFFLLFFLIPLILTPINYELFEYNKMMLTYALTVIIAVSWLVKMIADGKIYFRRTPWEIPMVLFLTSQIISTVLSIDRHTSIWGYYSRFNGGLLSTIAYFILYFAFVSNFPAGKIRKLFSVSLISGFLVAGYGILEHLGIDKDIWVQDVQNRVFSTLGQPNWLAAYLSILIPVTSGLFLKSGSREKEAKFSLGDAGYLLATAVFYFTLIYTKSRSGFLGFWVADLIFFAVFFFTSRKKLIKPFIFLNVLFLAVTFFSGAPFPQIGHFTYPEISQKLGNRKQVAVSPPKPTGDSIIDVGITESGTIREIVWKGAIDIFRHYPLTGTGVETFAYSYYKFRPVAHNMTSEWDFLYNKAHNEYLNYAANSGALGLGTHLLLIAVYIIWFLRKSFIKKDKSGPDTVGIGLFTGWLSILITNFFGFSVVIIQLFFFLIPAVAFILDLYPADKELPVTSKNSYRQVPAISYLAAAAFVFSGLFLLYTLIWIWQADVAYAAGYNAVRSQNYPQAYQSLKKAISINGSEPTYYDELSFPAAEIAVALNDDKQSTLAGQIRDDAVAASDIAVAISPNNVNFWKTRTRVFYILSAMDEKYFLDSKDALEKARLLSPTDPKITYNLALIYDKLGRKDEAKSLLSETIRLKPDYRDAYFALAVLYQRDKNNDKARELLNFILTRLNPNDADAKKQLEDLQ